MKTCFNNLGKTRNNGKGRIAVRASQREGPYNLLAMVKKVLEKYRAKEGELACKESITKTSKRRA